MSKMAMYVFRKCSSTVILKLFATVDPFHCTQNRCKPLCFVNIYSNIEKLDLIVS